MIVATPARLNDIIDNHPSDIELADVEVFVLDEVDCLLQMGFEPQVLIQCSPKGHFGTVVPLCLHCYFKFDVGRK